MKKSISLLLALVLCLSLCACGGNNTPVTEAPAETTQPPTTAAPTEPPIPRLHLGETASTNLVDFTLINAQFTIFASATTNTTYLKPMEGETVYGASIGKILMIPTFTMTNKDRAGSMSVSGMSADWPFVWSVNYGGTEYPVYGFDLNYDNQAIEMSPGAIIDPLTEYNLAEHGSSNYLLYAGETVSMRIVTVVNFEPTDLGDGFELKIALPNANDEMEEFIYVIPNANDPLDENAKAALYDRITKLIECQEYYTALNFLDQLGDYQDSADLYDFCMRRYAAMVGMHNVAEAFLTDNMNSFPQKTGEELQTIIPGNHWYVQGVGSNAWEFREDGKINDGWGNDRGWSVEGDLLVIRTDNRYKKVTVLELYDGGYVLLEDGAFYATFYKVEE